MEAFSVMNLISWDMSTYI